MATEQTTDTTTTDPPDALRRLGRLIGTWQVTDPSGANAVEGQVSYEWLDGESFLLQRVDLLQNGQRARGIEVIGHTWLFGGERDADITSRYSANGSFLDSRAISLNSATVSSSDTS